MPGRDGPASITSIQSATYSLHVFQEPTEVPRKLASAKSNTMGSACLPKRFITFWFEGLHLHRQLLKSAQRSAASARKVVTVLAYSRAFSAGKPDFAASSAISEAASL